MNKPATPVNMTEVFNAIGVIGKQMYELDKIFF